MTMLPQKKCSTAGHRLSAADHDRAGGELSAGRGGVAILLPVDVVLFVAADAVAARCRQGFATCLKVMTKQIAAPPGGSTHLRRRRVLVLVAGALLAPNLDYSEFRDSAVMLRQ
jgi:hypothetical protein